MAESPFEYCSTLTALALPSIHFARPLDRSALREETEAPRLRRDLIELGVELEFPGCGRDGHVLEIAAIAAADALEHDLIRSHDAWRHVASEPPEPARRCTHADRFACTS